jgi:hypothetical protein
MGNSQSDRAVALTGVPAHQEEPGRQITSVR